MASLLSRRDSQTNNSESFLQQAQTLRWLLCIIVAKRAWGKLKERQERQRLTCIPFVMHQITTKNDAICSLMTAALLRRVRPKPIRQSRDAEHQLVSESFTGGAQDGSKSSSIEWDLPKHVQQSTMVGSYPVVLVLADRAQDINCNYIRSFTRACTERGWVAGVIRIEQMRTNDLQALIVTIGKRMEKDVPLFIVGYGVGACKVTSFLGEGARTNTLPRNVSGAVIINNPIKSGSNDNEISNSRGAIAHVSVPTMIIFAEDDTQLRQNTEKVLPTMISNPNVIVVGTKGGGHAPWHSSERVWRSPSEVTLDTTWANYAAVKFFDSLLGIQAPPKSTEIPRSRL